MANKCEDFTNLSLAFMKQNIEAFLQTGAKTPISVTVCCGTAAFYALVLYTE